MRSQPERRVVITGMGVVSPLGNSAASLWDALGAGQSGVRKLELFPMDSFPMSFGGEAREFTGHISEFGPVEGPLKKAIRKGLKTICREAQMGIAAAQLALHDGGLVAGDYDPERTGAVFGSDYMVTMPEDFIDSVSACLDADGKFDFSLWASHGMEKLNPLWLLKYLPNMPAAHLSMYNDLRGPNNSITEREASSNLAVGEAARIIARGHADRMIAAATGTWLHPAKTIHAATQFELAANGVAPEEACRPFDKDRSGMVLGEGAGALVLEDVETALARDANILGEIAGSGASQVSDPDCITRRDIALANAMRQALRDAELAPESVGHVHAHGISTQSGDVAEALAIGEVFGETAVPVTAAKSYFGNLGAGSGVVELIASLLALKHDRLFPIRNYQTPDPDCAINVVTGDDTPPGDSFLNINVSMQGQASCVAVRRFEA